MDPQDEPRSGDDRSHPGTSGSGTSGSGTSGSGTSVALRGDLLTPLLREVPDVLLMLHLGPERQLRCQTALSSRPTSPRLASVAGRRVEEIFPSDALRRFSQHYEEAGFSRDSVRYEEELGSPESPLPVEAVLTPIFDAEGRRTHVFWYGRDVSESRAMAAALRESEERFRTLFERSSVGVAWVSPTGGFLEVNPALSELVGRTTEQLLDLTVRDLAHPEDRETVERVLAEMADPESDATEVAVRLEREGAGAVWTQAVVSRAGDRDGRPPVLVWQFQDTTQRRELQERLAHQALHDSLTGLPNRALFLDRVERAVTRLDRNPGMVAVLVLDLDQFDTVNDTHGHATGDRALVVLAERLREAIRQADTIARLGGDEFGLLCEDLETSGDANVVAARVREAVQTPLMVDGVEVAITGSIGVALTETTTDRPETLVRDALMALARAKVIGVGSTEVFDEAMREQAAARMKKQTDLLRAIESGEFRVFYQPQINLESGTIVGTEVLARWQHPERGLVTPAEFIGLAEETGVILPLGQWVLEQACAQAAKWRELRDGDDLTTWVNISMRQLAQPHFTEIVSKALADTGIEPSVLCIEVTEGVLAQESGEAVAVLRSLKELGLKIAIDDFGKGFSSLAYLKRLPIDMLKLDRTFVAGLGTSPEDTAIAAAVINLARAMGLTSIAEGVESPDQLAELRELGCDLAQGYFFSSPQPAEVIEELLGQDLRW